jgi:hypothetical protein
MRKLFPAIIVLAVPKRDRRPNEPRRIAGVIILMA